MTTRALLGEVLGTVYLLLPLLGGAVVHGACMKYGWLAFLARPMDALLLGFWLVFAFTVPATPLRVAISAVIVGAIHPLVSVAGYALGRRPTAR